MRYFAIVLMVAILYVSLDFMIDFRPAQIQSSYRFTLSFIPLDEPQWLQQDNLIILLIRRSDATVKLLLDDNQGLQDPDSEKSDQPSFARNRLRSRHQNYFVSYANGTDLGCIIERKTSHTVGEVCGSARYDFAGRAKIGDIRFQNLAIPDYNFSDDFKTLTLFP